MNRRSFIDKLVLGAAAFTILHGAGRVWKARREIWSGPPFIVGEWEVIPVSRFYDLLLQKNQSRRPDERVELRVRWTEAGRLDNQRTVRLSQAELKTMYQLADGHQTARWPR